MNLNLTTQEQLKDAISLFNDGKTDREVAREISSKYETELTSRSQIIKEAKKAYVLNMEIPTKEHYLKESLDDYEKIKEDANDVADLKEGLKLKVAVLRDRNELLGLAKAGVNIEINFNSKNLTDDQFLDNMNTVDIVPVEVVKFELAKEPEVEVKDGN